MRKIITALASITLAVGLLALVSPTAASAQGHCPVGQSELAQGPYPASLYRCVVYSTSVGHCTNLVGSWNDTVVDVTTGFGSGHGLRLWKDANCAGDSWPGLREGEDYITIPANTYTYLPDDDRSCNGGAKCGNWGWVVSSYNVT